MSLKPSENIWVKSGLIIALIGAALWVWAVLSGGIFLVAHDRKFDEATALTLYQYWYHYKTYPEVLKWIYISMGIATAVLLLPLPLIFKKKPRSLYGDARFATKAEIKKAGLLGDNGLIVGKLGRRYMMFGGSQHAIISAPTRSGKGVGIVIPNLLNWSDSVVVLDMKLENYQITSGFRKRHGQQVYLFNPVSAEYQTHRYNPLAYISEDVNFRIDDIQLIANMLFPDQPGTDPIWTATPRSLFVGIVLYLLETPGKLVTLGQVLRETLVQGDGSKYFARIINERANGEGAGALSGACVRGLNSYVSIASANTRAGIMTGFRSRLELWNNPLVDAATSANDFDLRDIRKKRMSIYIGVTPNNLERMAPLINLFFQQLIDLNTRVLPEFDKTLKYKTLLLMDEFTAIGKIPVLSKGISYVAGYGLRLMPIIQSPAQIVEVYGQHAAETFMTNHALQIVYPPKATETKTLKEIMEWLGYETVESKSRSDKVGMFTKKSPSESTSQQKRALLWPQEITSMGQDRSLIFMENCLPIKSHKVMYYKDKVFMPRLLPFVPLPKIDVAAHNLIVAADMPNNMTVEVPEEDGGGGQSVQQVKREVEAQDVPKLASLGLENFAVEFSKVEIPKGAVLDEKALNELADLRCRELGITF